MYIGPNSTLFREWWKCYHYKEHLAPLENSGAVGLCIVLTSGTYIATDPSHSTCLLRSVCVCVCGYLHSYVSDGPLAFNASV